MAAAPDPARFDARFVPLTGFVFEPELFRGIVLMGGEFEDLLSSEGGEGRLCATIVWHGAGVADGLLELVSWVDVHM